MAGLGVRALDAAALDAGGLDRRYRRHPPAQDTYVSLHEERTVPVIYGFGGAGRAVAATHARLEFIDITQADSISTVSSELGQVRVRDLAHHLRVVGDASQCFKLRQLEAEVVS